MKFHKNTTLTNRLKILLRIRFNIFLDYYRNGYSINKITKKYGISRDRAKEVIARQRISFIKVLNRS